MIVEQNLFEKQSYHRRLKDSPTHKLLILGMKFTPILF